ncbi:MAG TPA: nucleoid-associated protein [Chloroflexota bacterium]|nr:nucleoid-associated protein [Chloroflexota bacterium]
MRYATDIEVERAIVHIVDPRQRPVLSERALPLEANARLATYFADHIGASLRDSIARAARFVDLDTGIAATLCAGVFADRTCFVEVSRKLAIHLHDIVNGDGRIAAGDLAVCIYRARDGSGVADYLALLKIDPSEVLLHKTVHDDQGNLYVDFDFQANVLPTARERLQKCAFVRPLRPRPPYDMMVLDRQSGPGKADPVARFFMDAFLGAGLALDAQQRTDLLYRGLVSAQNRLRVRLSPGQNETLRGAIEQAIASQSINVDRWLEALPLPRADKEEIDRIVSRDLPDREFEIDAAYTQRLVARRRFRGDYDLRVTVQADHAGRVIRSVTRKDEAGRPPYYEVVIHTETWDEIVR